jgi:acyl-CoA thioester hydrolase
VGEPFEHRMRVRYAECDPQGVLFNANYLAWIDHTINEMWRAAFGSYTAMLERGVDIVVGEVRMRFLGSARFEEEIALEATITRLGTTGVTSRHRFRRVAGDDEAVGPPATGELLLDAEIRHVFVNRGTAVKTPIPDWARAGLTPWHVPDD